MEVAAYITRRSFLRSTLKVVAAAGITGLLGACAGGGAPQPSGQPPTAAPTSVPSKPTAAAPAAASLTPVKEQLLWIEDVEFGGDFAAISQGDDKQVGIERQLIPGGPQIDPVKAVAGGAVPIGLLGGSDTLIEARANGVPVKVFATYFQKAPSGVMSLASNPIKTPQDAIGKKIGLQAGARPAWSEIMAANKIPEDKVTIIPVGQDPTPLVSGQVDGCWSYAFNQPLIVKEQGRSRECFDLIAETTETL